MAERRVRKTSSQTTLRSLRRVGAAALVAALSCLLPSCITVNLNVPVEEISAVDEAIEFRVTAPETAETADLVSMNVSE